MGKGALGMGNRRGLMRVRMRIRERVQMPVGKGTVLIEISMRSI